MNTEVRKRRWIKGVAFVLIFTAIGCVMGVGATLLYLKYRFQRAAPQRDAIVTRMLDSVGGRVDLTPDERERLSSVLSGRCEEILDVRDQSFRSMEEILTRVDADIEAVLGPERFKTWYDYKEERMDRWRQRYNHTGQGGMQGGMHGGGMRGGGRRGMGMGMGGRRGMR